MLQVNQDDEHMNQRNKRPVEAMFVEDDLMEDGDDDDNTIGIRFKWLADNAETIDDIMACLQREMLWYQRMKQEGWELIGPVRDDYGFLRKKPQDHHQQDGPKKPKTQPSEMNL